MNDEDINRQHNRIEGRTEVSEAAPPGSFDHVDEFKRDVIPTMDELTKWCAERKISFVVSFCPKANIEIKDGQQRDEHQTVTSAQMAGGDRTPPELHFAIMLLTEGFGATFREMGMHAMKQMLGQRLAQAAEAAQQQEQAEAQAEADPAQKH